MAIFDFITNFFEGAGTDSLPGGVDEILGMAGENDPLQYIEDAATNLTDSKGN